jgi:glucose-6-phosphate isomerase
LNTKTFYNGHEARLEGTNIIKKQTKLSSLQGIFQDDRSFLKMDSNQVIYEVEMHENGLTEGDKGGLFFGISHIYPGKVGNEYFMTRGHIHQIEDTGEYYWGLTGNGLLIMTYPNKETVIESVQANSLHYIPGNVAHRLVNTGKEKLSVGACWLTESGHNYDKKDLFTVKVIEENKKYRVIEL